MLATLANRAVVRLSGPECRSFLQGLITQDVETLGVGQLRYGALLTPQGRLRWDLFIYGETDGLAIDVAASAREAFIQALSLYRLRAKVAIAAASEVVLAAWGSAPGGEDWLSDPRHPGLGWRKLAHAPANSDGDYTAHRLAFGAADPAVDAIEPLYPIDANLDLLNGIDFKKGCFIGQETTSRMKRRGQIKTRIAPLAYDGGPLDPGAEVMAEDLRAGRVLVSGAGRSLALLRMDRALKAPLACGDRKLQLDVPDWLAAGFALENADTQV